MQQVPIAEQPLGENIILNSLSLSLSMCLLHGLRGVLSDVVFETTIIHFVWSKIEYNVTSFLISMQRERERLEFDTSAKDRSNRRTTCTFN